LQEPHIKKPLNAFMLYMKEMRPVVQAECTLKESAAINQILGRRVRNKDDFLIPPPPPCEPWINKEGADQGPCVLLFGQDTSMFLLDPDPRSRKSQQWIRIRRIRWFLGPPDHSINSKKFWKKTLISSVL
jgi:hypothetical protein